MPIQTHRETIYQAPRDVVFRAIVAYVAHSSPGDDLLPSPAEWIVRTDQLDGMKRAVFTVTETPNGTMVRVDRFVSREIGGFDLFDFYGQEAQKWLYGIWEELGRIHASDPWDKPHAPEPPEGTAPLSFAPGARVVVLDHEEQARRGVVRAVTDGRCDVAFDEGGGGTFDAHALHPER